ncbi:MAG TPA: helix-turn-helix domain-containing protein [Acidimicrobiales bacterium]|jgi:AcrR family transcriptional regulator|nr:helix-turn-helix domain-containing protein [Acidimicrobiales bacterium]
MAKSASDAGDDGSRGSPRQRLRGEDRREALVATAVRLLATDGIDAVSMETVAARAKVSRPLVYKHFANRDELLAQVYRQQAAQLDAAIVAAVAEATGFEAKIRAMIRALLEAVTTHGPIFTPLVRAGLRGDAFRREQLTRDQRTVRFFARLAMAEYDLDKAEATAAVAMLLTGMESIRAQWRARPTVERLRFLEDLYVDLVTGGLASLATRGRPRPA